jgi:hypothetical protein
MFFAAAWPVEVTMPDRHRLDDIREKQAIPRQSPLLNLRTDVDFLDVEWLIYELDHMEGDLTVAVHEAQTARTRCEEAEYVTRQQADQNRRLRDQLQAVTDLCDQAEYAARTVPGVVWIGDLRAALGAADDR